jgi:Ca2+/Na+ antiporter
VDGVGAAVGALVGGTFFMLLVVVVLGLCVYLLPTLVREASRTSPPSSS